MCVIQIQIPSQTEKKKPTRDRGAVVGLELSYPKWNVFIAKRFGFLQSLSV